MILIFSCHDSRSGIMENIRQADSAAVLYYKTPGNPRFYSYVKIRDTKQLEQIINDVNDELTDNQDECISQGKIHFYSGTEEVLTIYYSLAPECKTFSFIQTGRKYFTGMSRESSEILNELKKKAIDPVAVN